MPFNDVREFIKRLEEEGEVKRVEEEVDWNLEAGAMIRRSNEEGLPSLFFQKVKGYPAGYTLFGEALSNHKRIAIAMDMEPDTHIKELIEEYIRRKNSPIKPVLVNGAPCKENIMIGDQIDLYRFPVPMIHEGDGGRYIGTWDLTISKDIDSDWVNWGMYRHMLHDRDTIGIQAGPPTHIMKMRQGWEAKGNAMEIAIAIGVEPISTLCAGAALPFGVSEVDVTGGIRQEPMQLVKCETIDLEVPATSEVVIEGELAVRATMDEGPFGEYTGYVGGRMQARPIIKVKAVTHRNDPVFTMGNEGLPVTSTHATHSVTRSAECLEILRGLGVPVTGAYVSTQTATLMLAVAVQAGKARADDVAHAIWASRLGVATPWIIVVEDDVDPFDLGQVMHAVVSKCHPWRGITRLEHSRGTALFPWSTRYEQKHLMGAKAYFDCTWPPDWDPEDVPNRCSFNDIYSESVKEKVIAKMAKFGC